MSAQAGFQLSSAGDSGRAFQISLPFDSVGLKTIPSSARNSRKAARVPFSAAARAKLCSVSTSFCKSFLTGALLLTAVGCAEISRQQNTSRNKINAFFIVEIFYTKSPISHQFFSICRKISKKLEKHCLLNRLRKNEKQFSKSFDWNFGGLFI